MRIVLADDAPALCALFGAIAGRLGHDIVGTAADCEGVRQQVRNLQPDVVVVDGRLPPAGALCVLVELRALAPAAAIYVVAALGEAQLVRSALAAGASGALLRPYRASQIAEALGAGGVTQP